MGPDVALPLSLTVLLVCANPLGSGATANGESSLRAAIETQVEADPAVVSASPVPAGVGVGSHYGWRTSTRTGNRTFHAGADFLSPSGTPVYAARAGIIEVVAREGEDGRRFAGYGNAVVVRHEGDGAWSFYAHLSRVDVEPGQYVLPGDKLGDVGHTTNGRFPNMVSHLHFEVREARPDGSSPFPGPYGRYNLDPEVWLAQRGVRFENLEDHAEDCQDHPEPVLVVAESTVGTGHF
ncbi:MAG: M23 family metallopeptidase [Sandaracinaceae bacterium]